MVQDKELGALSQFVLAMAGGVVKGGCRACGYVVGER